MVNIEEASQRFHSELSSRSIALDMLKEHLFVEDMGGILAEAGEIDDCIRCSYQARGMKVDGYYYDSELGNLHLIVSLWKDEVGEGKAKVTKTEIESTFNRCKNFYMKSRATLFERIEIANEAHDLAALIHDEQNDITNVTIIMITDGLTGKRPAEIENIQGVEVRKIIWDMERIIDYMEVGEKEIIQITFGGDHQVPCLSLRSHGDAYTSYLAYLPGNLLADLYSRHGTRMLDMNVRVFLSVRGKVNKGIRDTIVNNPSMFCAYNNGITVFARQLDYVAENEYGGYLRGATDFQIVNGGQTVASLYHAKKKQKADLSDIWVPMKLICITNEDDIVTLVPKISEYSNTQNKVSLTDLAANDRPHPELHEISKRLLAPDPTGGSKTSHWFYDKARGSYEETRRLLAKTSAEEREFDALHPKSQKFDKGLFGKVWNTYLKKPYLVSLGAQKNFVHFNMWLKDQESDLEPFFRHTVALLILWRDVERIVRKQGFEGYRHNIVAYTLSWLFELTESNIDLDRIWREQASGNEIVEAAEGMCHVVNNHIRATTQNVTEYCKKEECWNELLKQKFNLPSSIESSFIGNGCTVAIYSAGKKDEWACIEFCQGQGAQAWFELSKWLKQHSFLTPKARSQCFNMGKALSGGREPSTSLSYACRKIWQDSELRGWGWTSEIESDQGKRSG